MFLTCKFYIYIAFILEKITINTFSQLNYYLINMIKRCMFTCLRFLNNADDLADSPCIASATIVFANDLELPGFPTRNRGMRSSIHTTIMKTFSFKAALRAMLSSSLTWSRNTSWHLTNVMIYTQSVIFIFRILKITNNKGM